VRSFTCDTCGGRVFFENSVCIACGSPLGYCVADGRVVTLAADLTHTGAGGDVSVPCANRDLVGCNWLAFRSSGPGGLCLSCLLTRTRPADGDAAGLAAWALTEAAKRRLVFQLCDLRLPVVPRSRDPQRGLAFDLLSSAHQPVTTGHADGVVTIDLAEGSDPHREAMRVQMAEPYRTLLGHVRHEVGHYYWTLLVDGGEHVEPFRDCFGDERADYAQSLQRHYSQGSSLEWGRGYVSAYAAAHPWEDWAETFAHYLHIRDTLQTADAFGLSVPDPGSGGRAPAPQAVDGSGGIEAVIAAWLPLTSALNAVNRSMGKDDLYPFVLTPTVVAKLGFVHALLT
jgi:hypothetical protein